MTHRHSPRIARTTLALSLLAAFALPAAAGTEERLAALEARLDSLEKENHSLKTQLRQAERKVEATGNQVDKLASQGAASRAAWAEKTQLGGYGELHLNKLKNRKPGGADKDELDFHRFVLYAGHQFNDRLRLQTELEIEHALVKDTANASGPGEVELEQAYLDYMVSDALSVKGGLFLVPVGITNETHEPATFYGVERNPVETNIIPTTWWEGGAGLTARLGNGFTLDGAVTSGLKTTAANNYAVRDGRLKAAKATAKDPAYTARLKWTGVPGLELAGTVHYQADITQSADATAGAAKLFEGHAILNRGPFGLKALYAAWKLDGSGPKAVGADKQAGWYIEPSYKLSERWGVFARHSRWDNRAGDGTDSRYRQSDVGVNFWLHPDAVVKVDYQRQTVPNGQNDYDGFNVGIGYQF